MRNIGLVMLLLVSGEVSAATITLRGECRASGAVVTLGDVAEVISADGAQAAQLRGIEIMPSPAGGATRTLRARELQDLLELRGVNMIEHRLSGASHVTIGGAIVATAKVPRITTTQTRTAEQKLREAILQHLNETVADDAGWDVDPDVAEEYVRLLATATGPIRIGGGVAPWTGPQSFTVVCQGPTGVSQFNVAAKVSLPPSMIVAARNLPKGALVQPSDVKVQRVVGRATAADQLSTIAEAVGLETCRAVGEGQPLDRASVRAPVMVKKGEVVTVYARSGNVRVRTTARSKDEGAVGDVVNVEGLLDRKPFLARVSAAQEVEVFAKGATAATEPAEPAAPTPPRKIVKR